MTRKCNPGLIFYCSTINFIRNNWKENANTTNHNEAELEKKDFKQTHLFCIDQFCQIKSPRVGEMNHFYWFTEKPVELQSKPSQRSPPLEKIIRCGIYRNKNKWYLKWRSVLSGNRTFGGFCHIYKSPEFKVTQKLRRNVHKVLNTHWCISI